MEQEVTLQEQLASLEADRADLMKLRALLDEHRRDVLPAASVANREETDEEVIERLLAQAGTHAALASALDFDPALPTQTLIYGLRKALKGAPVRDGDVPSSCPPSAHVPGGPTDYSTPPTRLRLGDVLEGPDGSRQMVTSEGPSVVGASYTNPDGTITLAPGVRRVGNVLEKS